MLKDLLDNIPLLVIMAAIILLVIVLFVVLIVQIAKKKKQAKNSQPIVGDSTEAPASEAKPEEKPEDEKAEPHEEQEVPAEAPAEEKPEEKQESLEEKEQKPMKKEEKPPVKKTEPKVAAKPAPKSTAKAAPKAAEKKPVKAVAAAKVSNAAGKWVLFEEDRGGYGFRLIANNGEEMLRSSSPYATLQSAKSGIKTYQDNIAANRMEVVETKKGNFFVQINNASKRMLATSADYKNRTSAENAAASIKRWAKSAVIVVEDDEK